MDQISIVATPRIGSENWTERRRRKVCLEHELGFINEEQPDLRLDARAFCYRIGQWNIAIQPFEQIFKRQGLDEVRVDAQA